MSQGANCALLRVLPNNVILYYSACDARDLMNAVVRITVRAIRRAPAQSLVCAPKIDLKKGEMSLHGFGSHSKRPKEKII